MAKYDKEVLKEVLASDEYDVMVPEFIARASSKVSQAAANIHECQEATIKSSLAAKQALMDAKIGPGDPFYDAIANSVGITMMAQATMWEAISGIQDSLATVTRRMSHT